MSLFSKKNLSKKHNKYDITEEDMIDDLEGFPVGVVVKMMEEQENQGYKSNVKVFQKHIACIEDGFDWAVTIDGWEFWSNVINKKDFSVFFERYHEYMMY